jgi:hypothetical protein
MAALLRILDKEWKHQFRETWVTIRTNTEMQGLIQTFNGNYHMEKPWITHLLKIQTNPIISQLNSLACNKNLEISCIILRKRRLYIKIIIEIILNVEMDASHPASCRV